MSRLNVLEVTDNAFNLSYVASSIGSSVSRSGARFLRHRRRVDDQVPQT